MPTLEDILGNLRVAETDGDVVECADALECWMSRVSVEAIASVIADETGKAVQAAWVDGWSAKVARMVVAWINEGTKP